MTESDELDASKATTMRVSGSPATTPRAMCFAKTSALGNLYETRIAMTRPLRLCC